jgi:sugar phosphate isomerase/epimerase
MEELMEIGLSSASFYPLVNTEDSIKIMKELGFKVGEIFLNSTSEYETEFIKLLINEKEKYEFEINSVHGFSSSYEPFLFETYKRRRDDMMVYFKKICKAGRQLGAKCYTFHGMRNIDINNLNLDFVIERYNELTYIAAETGIMLAQENVSWCMSHDLNFLSTLKEKCKYPLHFTLDIKQAYKAGIDPVAYIKVMKDSIVNFHINDRDESRTCLLPGKGNVNFKRISKELANVSYSGNGIIEVYRDNYLNYNELVESSKLLKEYFH